MKKCGFGLLIIFISLQLGADILDRYQKAEQLFHQNVKDKIYNEFVQVQWHDGSWLSWLDESEEGIILKIVNAANGKTWQVSLKEFKSMVKNKCEIDPGSTDFTRIKLGSKGNTFTLNIKEKTIEYNIKNADLTRCEPVKKSPKMESLSPDKKYIATVNKYNVQIQNLKTGKTIQFTTDGKKDYEYGTSIGWYEYRKLPEGEYKREINVTWSKNSRYILVPLTDWRDTKEMYLYRSTPDKGFRADVFSYRRPISGEQNITNIEFKLFEVNTGKQIPFDFEPTAQMLYPHHFWAFNSGKIISSIYTRGWKDHFLYETDIKSGKKRLIIKDSEKTFVDLYQKTIELIEETNELICSSERDGWNHLYLYDFNTGQLKNCITKGQFFVRDIKHLDKIIRKIYFTASGKESGWDPYFKALYVVNFDGKDLKCLTPEKFDHSIKFSKNGQYFTDNYSRIDFPNTLVLRTSLDGKVVSVLERSDITYLKKIGWKPPEAFKVKAGDGITDIYGVMYKPFDFDPGKKYPVLDGTYTGPHTIRSPKTFARANINYEGDQSLAQLGFIVINIDGRGTAYRSKKFRNYSYVNLGSGIDDHVIAIRELAKKYPFLDLTKVGIYGNSVGGYDTVRGLFKFPDFYHVGVAGAGSHDYRIAKAWWPEKYLGYPVVKEIYDKNSNFYLAENLKGKLLLVHGNMDENVNPATTLRLADELIKANRDFDLLILPNAHHGAMWRNKYFFRKRWDYFVSNLLNIDPPKLYKIK